jgi:hypothetical protein
VQGEKMTNIELNLANSELVVKASGSFDCSKDLELPQGKSIAELLYDQKKEHKENTTE